MKALTVCQPYAEMIARGEKAIENRTWATMYRGTIYIHAGQSRAWMSEGDAERYPDLVFGAVIAVATLTACLRVAHLPDDLRDNIHAGGPWCWVLREVTRIVPVPARGALGLWEFER